jgi:hypothetical protein
LAHASIRIGTSFGACFCEQALALLWIDFGAARFTTRAAREIKPPRRFRVCARRFACQIGNMIFGAGFGKARRRFRSFA